MNTYEVVVVGAGLIGSATAKYVSKEFPNGQTLLIGPGAGLDELDHGINLYLIKVISLHPLDKIKCFKLIDF